VKQVHRYHFVFAVVAEDIASSPSIVAMRCFSCNCSTVEMKIAQAGGTFELLRIGRFGHPTSQ